jgi:hypothetical protein
MMTTTEMLMSAYLLGCIARSAAMNRALLQMAWDGPRREARGSPPPGRMAVVIAVYREEKVIEETVAHFRKHFGGVPVFYVTTGKEERAGTRLRLERLGERIIHCPHLEGNKATQLNYALNLLLRYSDFELFAFYDADSRPEFPEAAPLPEPTISQQPCLYLENFHRLGFLMRGSALYQSRWSWGFERPMWLHREVKYCVGHGLVVDRRVLGELRFREDTLTEDIAFGTEASLRRIRFRVLQSVDRAEHASTLRVFALQNGRWFAGSLWSGFQLLRRNPSLALLARQVELLFWPASPVVWVGAVLYAAMASSGLVGGFLLAHLLLDPLPSYTLTLGVLRGLGHAIPFRVADLVGFALRPLLNVWGPLLYALGLHQRAGSKRDRYFIKTER